MEAVVRQTACAEFAGVFKIAPVNEAANIALSRLRIDSTEELSTLACWLKFQSALR